MTPDRRGFTILEILIAVVVTAIGFAAIFSLQIGTMQGNISARETTGAVALGERYVEMLRREAFQWTSGSPPGPWLDRAPRRWHTLTPLPVDHNGLPNAEEAGGVGSGLDRQRFCVHYWIDPLTDTYDGVINARVRVIWPRASLDDGDALRDACLEQAANDFVPNVDRWFTLTVPATIRRHPST